MNSRSALVYAPAIPFSIDALTPQQPLASVAGALLAAGHETRIHDYATAEALSWFGTPGIRATSRSLCEEGWENRSSRVRRLRRVLRGLFEEAGERWRRQVVTDLCDSGRWDFVVFLAKSRRDFMALQPLSVLLRAWRPQVCQFVMGPYVELYGRAVLSETSIFDGACLADPERSVPAVAERLAQGRSWTGLPNMAGRGGGAVSYTTPEAEAALEAMGHACYEPAVYPALAENEKLRCFSVEHARGSLHVSHGEPAGFGGALRVRRAEDLGDESVRLQRFSGSRVLFFEGEGTPSAHAERLAHELLGRCPNVIYGRRAHVAYTDPSIVPLLSASGCVSMGFRIDTGSQRLLEDFYGHNYCVSQIERLLKVCSTENLFTATRFRYPCPAEDRHTRAETLRLLYRCRPSSVAVGVPLLAPGSLWSERAAEFGFRGKSGHFPRWAAGAGHSPWWWEEAEAPAHGMDGWPARRVHLEQQALLEEVADLGIATDVDEKEALIARAAGCSGKEVAYCARLRQHLLEADAARVAETVASFNRGTGSDADIAQFRSFRPVLAAVGN